MALQTCIVGKPLHHSIEYALVDRHLVPELDQEPRSAVRACRQIEGARLHPEDRPLQVANEIECAVEANGRTFGHQSGIAMVRVDQRVYHTKLMIPIAPVQAGDQGGLDTLHKIGGVIPLVRGWPPTRPDSIGWKQLNDFFVRQPGDERESAGTGAEARDPLRQLKRKDSPFDLRRLRRMHGDWDLVGRLSEAL